MLRDTCSWLLPMEVSHEMPILGGLVPRHPISSHSDKKADYRDVTHLNINQQNLSKQKKKECY